MSANKLFLSPALNIQDHLKEKKYFLPRENIQGICKLGGYADKEEAAVSYLALLFVLSISFLPVGLTQCLKLTKRCPKKISDMAMPIGTPRTSIKVPLADPFWNSRLGK